MTLPSDSSDLAGGRADSPGSTWRLLIGDTPVPIEVMSQDGDTLVFQTPAPCAINTVLDLEHSQVVDDLAQVVLRRARLLAGCVTETGTIEYRACLESAARGADTPSDSFVDQRRAPRLKVTFQVYSRDLQRFRALVNDVSATGAQIVTDEPLEVQRHLALELDFDDPYIPRIRCVGEVKWCRQKDPHSYISGLQFTVITEEDRANIRRFMAASEKTRSRYG